MFIQRPHLVIIRAVLGVPQPTARKAEQEVDARTCMWTSMRRHILSSRRGGCSLWPRRNCLCRSRYASIRTLGEPTLRWLGA